jgi:glycosyltransferase involved in cell wall biosynthesis
MVVRKVSMNEHNVVGLDFEKYNREAKPSGEIRRKIANFVAEYRETKDTKAAVESFAELCRETSTAKFNFVGYILHNAFSHDSEGWQNLFNFIIDHLYLQDKLLNETDLIEG